MRGGGGGGRGGSGGSCCFPREVIGVYVGLAFVNGVIALLAFSQLIKIHARSSRSGWARQEVFHLLIGSSNIVYSIYFVLAIVASCQNWLCWSYSCGFIIMSLPKILSFAAFLMLLSFCVSAGFSLHFKKFTHWHFHLGFGWYSFQNGIWLSFSTAYFSVDRIDLCHQADDEDYEEEDLCFHEALLEVAPNDPSPVVHADSHRSFFRFCSIHVGSRQKIVILVTLLIFFVMITFAVLMWTGMGSDVIDSSWLARVYVCLFATVMLLLGGALACYGFLLCSKMRRVRSDRATFETQKVAGMAVVSVLCFASRAFVAFFTTIPVLYYCQELTMSGLYTSLLLILYHFIGSSVPSAFVLLIMRDLPPIMPTNTRDESATITFTDDDTSAAVQNPERWLQ